MRHRKSIRLAAMTAVAAATAIAVAEDVHVNVGFVEIRSDPSSAGDVLGKAAQGDTLNVLEHDGRWMKVHYNAQTGAIEGYVNEHAVTADAVNREFNTGESSAGTAEMTNAAAGKGLEPGDYAKAKGYDKSKLDALIAQAHSLCPAKVVADFEKTGKVGIAKGAR